MNAFRLAWRNLLRNRRRSLMTLVAMVLGLVTVLLFGGYIREINYAMRTGFVMETGHLQIQHKDYFQYGSGNPAAFGIAGYEQVMKALRQDAVLAPLVAVVTPVLQFGGIAGNFGAGVSRTVFVTGNVVDEQTRMRDWNEYGMRRVTLPLSLAGTAADSAIIGTGVARVLQLCAPLKVADCEQKAPVAEPAGDALAADIAALSDLNRPAAAPAAAASGPPRIEILATNSHGAPNVAAVKVVRAAFQGVKELDEVYVGMHLAPAQKLIFGAAAPQVTAIAVQLKHTADLPAARARIGELLRGPAFSAQPLDVLDYETLNPFYGQTTQMFAMIFGFVAILIGSIVLFTVGNTMSMAVVERTAEIGTLRAIGLRRGGIRALFVLEGVALAGIGTLIGVTVALALAWLINHLGLTWIPPGRTEPVALGVHLAGENLLILAAAVGLVIVGALSAILPAARAARMNIVEALRHV